MPAANRKFERVAIIAHPQLKEAALEADLVSVYLESRGISNTQGFWHDEALCARIKEREFDLIIALGGDGTMLRAGHLGGQAEVPILGINLGRFGFLTEVDRDQWRNALPGVLAGQFWIERRMMLCAEHWRSQTMLGRWEVLNEIVVSRGHLVRPVHLVADVDGRYLTTFVADGLIAATATGSTAYALAAGGPILPPELRNILLIAVAPHLSIDRAIVLAEGSQVSIRVQSDQHAVLSPDGQISTSLLDGDQVVAFASDHSVQFIKIQDPGYFYRNLTSHMSQNPSTGNQR